MSDDKSWISVEEAARRLGVSGATVRRRVRDGTLEGYREQRPQGEVYRVLSSALPPDSRVPRKTEEMAEENRENVSVAPDTALLRMLDAFVASAAENANLRFENGRLQTERDAAVERAERAEQQADDERALSRELEFKAACAEAHAADLERQLAAARARPWWLRWLP